MTAKRRPPRLWWYEVTHVEGFNDRTPPVEVGSIIRDRWKADMSWTVMNTRTAQFVGGWTCRLLGEAAGEFADRPPTEAPA